MPWVHGLSANNWTSIGTASNKILSFTPSALFTLLSPGTQFPPLAYSHPMDFPCLVLTQLFLTQVQDTVLISFESYQVGWTLLEPFIYVGDFWVLSLLLSNPAYMFSKLFCVTCRCVEKVSLPTGKRRNYMNNDIVLWLNQLLWQETAHLWAHSPPLCMEDSDRWSVKFLQLCASM